MEDISKMIGLTAIMDEQYDSCKELISDRDFVRAFLELGSLNINLNELRYYCSKSSKDHDFLSVVQWKVDNLAKDIGSLANSFNDYKQINNIIGERN